MAGAAAVVVAALAPMPKPPKDPGVALGAGAAWPKVKPPWGLAWDGAAGCALAVIVPNVKALLLVDVVAAELRAGAGATVEAAPNWKALPVEGAGVALEAAVVTGAALQFPNNDLTVGWVAGSVGAMAPAVLLDSPMSSCGVVEGAEVAAVAAAAAVERDGPNALLEVALPKRGLKVGTAGTFSGAEVARAEVVVVAPKIGLNIEAKSGLGLPAAVVAGVVVDADIEEAVEASGLVRPNRPDPPRMGVVVGGLVTWPSTWVKAEGMVPAG